MRGETALRSLEREKRQQKKGPPGSLFRAVERAAFSGRSPAAGLCGRPKWRERVQHGNNEGLHNITFVWLAGAPNVQLASEIKPPVRFILQCR